MNSVLMECRVCRSSKSSVSCEICESPLCTRCAETLREDRFVYAKEKPEILTLTTFCPPCFDDRIQPEVSKYDETLTRAKQVAYLPKTYKAFVPVLKKGRFEVTVESCDDRNEAIMHLAFQAAEQGFNAIIKADVQSKKVRNNGYQKSVWSGRAWPAKIDEKRLELEEYREEVWRRGY